MSDVRELTDHDLDHHLSVFQAEYQVHHDRAERVPDHVSINLGLLRDESSRRANIAELRARTDRSEVRMSTPTDYLWAFTDPTHASSLHHICERQAQLILALERRVELLESLNSKESD